MRLECSYTYITVRHSPSLSFSSYPPLGLSFRLKQVAGCPGSLRDRAGPTVRERLAAERSSIPLDLLCDPDFSRRICQPLARHNNDLLRIHSIPELPWEFLTGRKSLAAIVSSSGALVSSQASTPFVRLHTTVLRRMHSGTTTRKRRRCSRSSRFCRIRFAPFGVSNHE